MLYYYPKLPPQNVFSDPVIPVGRQEKTFLPSDIDGEKWRNLASTEETNEASVEK